jgi:hypothetical protein
LVIAAASLLSANIITIGADLAGMSDAVKLLTGLDPRPFTIFSEWASRWPQLIFGITRSLRF